MARRVRQAFEGFFLWGLTELALPVYSFFL